MIEAYKIGVALTMTSNAPALLKTLASHLLGVNVKVTELEKNFGKLSKVLGGGLAIAGGSALIGMFGKIADHGVELLDQQDKLIRAGRTHAEVAQLTADAYKNIAKAVPTATAADILRVANQLTVVTGSFSKAIAATPEALKIEGLLSNVTGKSAEGAGHALWRAIEMKGLTAGDEHQQAIGQKLIESFVQNIAGSGGKLTSNDYQLMAKRGGAYWAHATPEFLSGPMSVFAADVGGDSAGTTMATFGQFLSGATTMSKQQFETLDSLGLIDPKKISHDLGGRVNAQPGAIEGSLKYGGDYFGWVQKELIPALRSHGIEEGAEEDSILAKIGRNRNTTRMLTMFSDDGFIAQIAKDLEVFHKSLGLDKAYDSYVSNDPKGVKSAYDQQYSSMMQAIGAPLMQSAIPIMRDVTSMFSSIGEFANKNPETIANVGKGFAILGGALIGGGMVAVLAAIGPAGWLAVGLIALAGAVAVWKPGVLTEIGAGYSQLWDAIKNADIKGILNGVVAVIKGEFHLLPEEIQSWPGRLYAAIEKMGADLVAMMRDMFNNMIGKIRGFLHIDYMGDGVGGGGGFINASYTTIGGGIGSAGSWNGSVLSTSKGWSAAGGSPQERAAFIRSYAASIGLDPETHLRIAQAEGFYTFTGDHGLSHGDFQLYDGGGLGNAFRRLHPGVNPADPMNWKLTDKFALDYMRVHGHSEFHGAARVGIGNWQGIDRMHRSVVPPPRNDRPIVLHHKSVLDGKVLSKSVTRYQTEAAMMPLGIHGQSDDYGSFVGPGTTFQPT